MEKIKQRLILEKDIFPNDNSIELEVLNGGLSNILYIVNQQYVYRQYLDVPNDIQDIEYHLSNRGMCPRTIRLYDDARLEEYIPKKPPSHYNFLQNLHTFIPLIREIHQITLPNLSSTNPIFSRLSNWLKTSTYLNDYKVANEFAKQCLQMWNEGLLNNFKQCICHNDLHHGNFLDTNLVIDFEYSGINYELYDWANMANELELIPGEIEYILQPNPLTNSLILQILLDIKLKDLIFFRNVSHLFWGCWALHKVEQKSYPIVIFDYQKYADLRFSLIKETLTEKSEC